MSSEHWPFGTIVRRQMEASTVFWYAMIVEDNGTEIEMITLGNHYPTNHRVPGFYAPDKVWTWQMRRGFWEVVNEP